MGLDQPYHSNDLWDLERSLLTAYKLADWIKKAANSKYVLWMAIASSKTYRLLVTLFEVLPKRRRRSLLRLFPLAIISAIADVIVITLISRIFTLFAGDANSPSIPFGDAIANNQNSKILLLVLIYICMNWVAAFLKLFLRSQQLSTKGSIKITLLMNFR